MQSFSYYIEQSVCVIRVQGEITINTIGEINRDMEPLIEEVKKGNLNGIVMDCKKVSHIDSAGFSSICGKFVSLKMIEKKLALVNMSESSRRLFDRLGLSRTFNLDKNINSLIQSMGPRIEAIQSNNQDDRMTWKHQPQEMSLKNVRGI